MRTAFTLSIATTTIASLVLGLIALETRGLGEGLLVLMGSATLGVLLVPVVLRKHYDLLEPITIIILMVMIGTTIKILYVVFWSSDHISSFILLGRSPLFILETSLWMFIGISCIVGGYMMHLPAADLSSFRILRPFAWRPKRIVVVGAISISIALYSIYSYVTIVGVNFGSADEISSKRFYEVEGSATGYGSLTYLVWGGKMVEYSLYVIMAWYFVTKKKSYIVVLLMIVMLIISLMLPIVISSRQSAIIPFVVPLIILYYLGKSFNAKYVIVNAFAGLFLLMSLTALRQDSSDSLVEYFRLDSIVEETVGGRHYNDIVKTAHVMEGVPRQIDYLYGRTFIDWVLIVVPRTLWPQKPFSGQGKLVGDKIFGYGDSRTGVPPGLFAEIVMNFGKLAVPFGAFIYGIFLRFLYISFKPYRENPFAVVVYAVSIYPLTFTMLNNQMGQAITHVILNVIPIYLMFSLTTVGISRRPVSSRLT